MKKEELLTEDRRELLKYGLEPDELSGIHVLSLEPKEPLLGQGETMECLYILCRGTARVCTNARNGKNLIICYYVSHGILGDAELMRSDRSASTTAIADSPLRMIAIPIAQNEAYLKGNLAFMTSVAENLAEKLLNSSSVHAASALYTSEERLCSYILMSQHNGLFTDVLNDVAQSVAMSYRHVFRIIGALCADGILEKTESGYKILDLGRLHEKSAV